MQDLLSFPAVFGAENGAVLFFDVGGCLEMVVSSDGDGTKFDSPICNVELVWVIAEDMAGRAAFDRVDEVPDEEIIDAAMIVSMPADYVEAGPPQRLLDVLVRFGFQRLDVPLPPDDGLDDQDEPQ